MLKYVSLLFVIVLVVVSCTPAPPPPPPKAAEPPPPTPEQIAGEIRQSIGPLAALVADPGKDGKGAPGSMTEEIQTQVINGIKGAKSKHSVTENGRAALATISHEIEDIISKGRDQERWRVVLCGIDAYEAINPGATKMARLKERAKLYMNRPVVHLTGFFHDKQTDDTFAFLKVELRPTREVHEVRARKGDEFDNLKLLDIVGNNSGVELEYLAIPGETWRVTKEQQ